MQTTMTTNSKRQRERLYIYKNGKKCETFLYSKSQTLCKKRDNFCYVFIYKNPDTLCYAIFMNFLKLAFVYKKHDTLRYVKFLYSIQKARHFAKIKKNCVTFLYTKSSPLCVTRFFMEFFKLAGGGGLCKKQ